LSDGPSANSRCGSGDEAATGVQPLAATLEAAGGGAWRTAGRLRQAPAQAVRARLGDDHVDEAADEGGGSGEVHPAVVGGAAGELARVLLRRPLDEHTLAGADHRQADGARLGLELRLQARQALLLDGRPDVIGERGRRRAGPAAVEEAERLSKPTSRASASVAAKSRSLSPGNPTMKSEEIAMSGRAARSLRTFSLNSSVV